MFRIIHEFFLCHILLYIFILYILCLTKYILLKFLLAYATALQTLAVGKAGQGDVCRPQVQGPRKALGKPP